MRRLPIPLLAVLLAGCASGPASDTPSETGPAATTTTSLTVTSSAFGDGDPIPERFTCTGEGEVPPLAWSGIPAGSDSLALIVSDPDSPEETFYHWVVYDLPPETTSIPDLPAGAVQGTNSADLVGWVPPCPPSGTHRYVFTLYVLDEPLEPAVTSEIIAEIERVAVASGTLTGLVTGPEPQVDPSATPSPSPTASAPPTTTPTPTRTPVPIPGATSRPAATLSPIG